MIRKSFVIEIDPPVSPAELLVFEKVKTLLAEQDLAQALHATSLSRRDLTRKSESAR